MTRLIVSVRSASEAETACAAGVDLIDVKEPRHGSLGAATVETVRQVVRQVAGRKPVSVALGDLSAAPEIAELTAVHGLQFAKLGLAGSAAASGGWQHAWRDALDCLAPVVIRVAVIYADHRRARSPRPSEILEAAPQLGCGAVLVDTWDKAAGKLLDHWTLADVERFADQVQSAGMLAVVAGALDEISIASIVPLGPSYIAVRGAVCSGGRSGRVDREKVQRLVRLVHEGTTGE